MAIHKVVALVAFLAIFDSVHCGNKIETDPCAPRNDCSGHVTGCDADGKKECMTGWAGDDCTELAGAELCSKFCVTGICFNDGAKEQCCCPEGRKDEQCDFATDTGEEPCPEECPDTYCARVSSDINADFRCDKKKEDQPTTTPDDGETTGSDSTDSTDSTVSTDSTDSMASTTPANGRNSTDPTDDPDQPTGMLPSTTEDYQESGASGIFLSKILGALVLGLMFINKMA